MGGASGKLSCSGILQSASASPLDGFVFPSETSYDTPPATSDNSYNQHGQHGQVTIKVPHGKKGGDTIMVKPTSSGPPLSVQIPWGKHYGDSFYLSDGVARPHSETIREPRLNTKVYTSALQAIPGMVVVVAKPFIYACASETFAVYRGANLSGVTATVNQLMNDAHSKMIELAIECGCNAVLGMSFNVTNDSTGDDGRQKIIIVTLGGTPSIVTKASDSPVVTATTFTVPPATEVVPPTTSVTLPRTSVVQPTPSVNFPNTSIFVPQVYQPGL